MRDVRPIRDEDDLAWALGEVAAYFDRPPPPGSEEADRFDVLSDLIEAYESRRHPVPLPDPVSLILSFMEATGRTQADLAALLGSKPRASEVLGRKRPLSMGMVRKLNREWGLPADCLIQPGASEAA